MRFYEIVTLKPMHIALISALLITTNPLQMPRDPSANAVEIVEPPKPILVERTPEAAKAYAKTQLDTFGWDTPAQWACLLDLWTGESNWRPSAYNKQAVYQNGERLHAGGIPQILGLDPDTTVERQIERGFLYIESRYDTPCNANSFWHRNFWYQSSRMSEQQKKPSAIDNALADIARVAFEEPAICTGWVLVSEWTDGTAKGFWTVVFADDQNPDWRQKGLVHHALDTWGEDDLYDNNEEEDDSEREDGDGETGTPEQTSS